MTEEILHLFIKFMKPEAQMQAEKLFLKTCKKIGRTIREKAMIREGDRVLLGLSGGKDSMILLECLVKIKKSLPFSFEVFPAHILPVNIGYQINLPYLEQFCHNLGLKLIIKEIEPDFERKEKAECFVCSWHRRKALFDLTRELNCNKLAFGHHRDDALQTFMINLVYHGSISSMPYSLNMFERRAQLIRPLMDLWEKDLDALSKTRNYAAIEKSCPHEKLTKRAEMASLLDEMEAKYIKAKINMFHALGNIYDEYLPKAKKRPE